MISQITQLDYYWLIIMIIYLFLRFLFIFRINLSHFMILVKSFVKFNNQIDISLIYVLNLLTSLTQFVIHFIIFYIFIHLVDLATIYLILKNFTQIKTIVHK